MTGQIGIAEKPLPARTTDVGATVETSSQVRYMNAPGWLHVRGTGFNRRTKLVLDPPLPEGRFVQHVRPNIYALQ